MTTATKPYAYFALGFGQHGCMPDSEFTSTAVYKRGDITAAIREAIDFYDLPKALLNQISIKRTWAHAVRHGLSSTSLELSTPTMSGCLMFMGLTEAEFMERENENV